MNLVVMPWLGALAGLAFADLLVKPAWWWLVIILASALAEAFLAWLRIFWRSRQDHVFELEERIEELEDALTQIGELRTETVQ